jgi:hypothetical protein
MLRCTTVREHKDRIRFLKPQRPQRLVLALTLWIFQLMHGEIAPLCARDTNDTKTIADRWPATLGRYGRDAWWPELRSCPAHPQRKRSRVPKTRRFRHSVPRLSAISRCLGPTRVSTRFIIYRGRVTFTPCSERGPLLHLAGDSPRDWTASPARLQILGYYPRGKHLAALQIESQGPGCQ